VIQIKPHAAGAWSAADREQLSQILSRFIDERVRQTSEPLRICMYRTGT
jgi:hypothetical protein